jgi:YVTN family beta-propeller protein
VANAVAVIDPADNRVLETRSVGTAPGSIAASAGAVWVANANDGTVTKIEPISGRTRTFGANVAPGALAATANGVWVAATDRSALVRINAKFGSVDDQIQVGPNQLSTNEALAVAPNYRHGLTGMAVGGGAVWTGDMARSRVMRIDLHSDRVLAGIPISPLPFAIVANRTGAWVATTGGSRNSSAELIHIGVDGRRLSSSRLAFTPGSIALGEGSVWITGRDTNSLWRLSQEDETVEAAIPVGAAPNGVAIGYGSVWVANTDDGTVTRIDPVTNVAVATIRIGHSPTGVTTGFGRVWVTLGED